MTQITKICTQALRRLGVVSAYETAAAEHLADALTSFNGIMHGLADSGHITSHTTQAGTDTFALGDAFDIPMACAIAVDLQGAFLRSVDHETMQQASFLWGRLDAALRVSGDQATEPALQTTLATRGTVDFDTLT